MYYIVNQIYKMADFYESMNKLLEYKRFCVSEEFTKKRSIDHK